MSGWVAGAVAVGTIGGALISSNATSQAAKGQANAANTATQESAREYDQTREDNAPWQEAGKTALGQLGDLTKDGGDLNRKFTMNDFTTGDPGYAFRMSQGQQAIERSAAARGGALGGGTLKALANYGQDYASNEYQNAFSRWNTQNNEQFNRLSGIAGTGQTANAADAQAGQAALTTSTNAQMGAANASGAATIAGANSINNAINTGVNAWTYYQTNKK
jgi:hypothetical protein